jgi:fructuronate reductase
VTASPSGRRLSRGAREWRAAAPVALVHLGLGSFYRAHQAWYTDRAADADSWGYAAFTGRSAALAESLEAQDGLYTLITRAVEGDRFGVIGSISRAHAGTDHDSWLGYLASSDVHAVTITVTEAGYVRRAGGGLDADRPEVQADVAALRGDLRAAVATTPGRLVAGCAARRAVDGGPLALVPCDNLPDNGALAAEVARDLAELVDPGLAAWIDESISFVTTVVDRITPRTTPEDRAAVLTASGVDDASPVGTEPFSEWVLSGRFPAGRPRWEDAGATFTDDIEPYEQRKLWLLNGAHSMLAYTGLLRGHRTVAEAVTDDSCRQWMQEWWSDAARHLPLPSDEVDAYQAALLDRFANPRMHHRLDQIATDGSQKLPVRILPVLRAERAAGRLPAGAIRVLGAWVAYLRQGAGAVGDVRAEEMVGRADGPLPEAVRRVLEALDPTLVDDRGVLAAVQADAEEIMHLPSAAKPS